LTIPALLEIASILKGQFFSDNLKIHAFQPALDRPQDTVEFQNLSVQKHPKTYGLTPAI
jgi:hypothetical protein